MEKTLGDFIQIITYAATHQPKVFITFDLIAGCIAGILGSTTILDAGTARRFVFRRLFITSGYFIDKNVGLLDWCANAFEEITRPEAGFGKINNVSKRLKFMSHLELKNKLKSVGIKITKNVRGKRKYLSRKELENKALLFNKLQNTAKKMKIRIMYKRNGMYKYKTYKRLQKEINSKYNVDRKYNINRKYKKPVVRNFNFG
jgi:transposase